MAKKPRLSELEPDTFSLASPPTAASPPPPPPPANKPVSNADAIRQALERGLDSPTEIVKWIKDQFDMTVTPQAVSTQKTLERKKAQISSGTPIVRTRIARKPTLTPVTSQPIDGLDLAKNVKEMIAKYGAHAVIQMAEILGD